MLKKLFYLWRVVATGISFVVFGLGGILLSISILPYLTWRYKDEFIRKKKTRFIIHKAFQFFLKMMQFFGIYSFELDEARRLLQKTNGKIIISNHPSLIDVVIMISIIPHADCIVKKSLWDNFFLKHVVQAAGYIKNDNDIDVLMAACEKSLNEGACLIIFPEGTRTTPDMPIKLQRGASNIALRCKKDFIPLTISCTPTTLTKNEMWYQVPEKPAHFSLKVGPIISTSPYLKDENRPAISARILTSDIKKYFQQEIANNACT